MNIYITYYKKRKDIRKKSDLKYVYKISFNAPTTVGAALDILRLTLTVYILSLSQDALERENLFSFSVSLQFAASTDHGRAHSKKKLLTF